MENFLVVSAPIFQGEKMKMGVIGNDTLNEFKGKKVSVYFSNSKHSQQSFAAPRS